MREFNYTMRRALSVGLRKTEQNRRGQQALIKSNGAYPDSGALGSLELLDRIDTSGITPQPEFPYPQVFKLKQLTIVCTATQIFEYDELSETLTLLLSGLEAGTTWSVADFGNFVAMVNGRQVVYRDGESLQWTTIDEIGIYSASSICNLNGQIILAAPQTQVTVSGYLFQDGDVFLLQDGSSFEFN